MPKITEQDVRQEENQRIAKYAEMTPAAIQQMKEKEEQRRLEQERLEMEKEKAERKRQEDEEKRRKEEEERKKKEEEERLRKEEEERIRKEKEEILRQKEDERRHEAFAPRKFNMQQNLEKLKKVLNETAEKVEKMTREEEERKNNKKLRIEMLETSIRGLGDQIVTENALSAQKLLALRDEYAKVNYRVVARRDQMCETSKEIQKLQDLAVKEDKRIQAAVDKAVKSAAKKNPGKLVDKSTLGVDTTNKYNIELEKTIESDPEIKNCRAQMFAIEAEIDGIDRNTKDRHQAQDDLRKELKSLLDEKEPVNIELESSRVFLKYMQEAVERYEKNGEQYAWDGVQYIEFIKICQESPENPYFNKNNDKVVDQSKSKSTRLGFL